MVETRYWSTTETELSSGLPGGERKKRKEAVHKVHNCVVAPDARGDGNLEETANFLLLKLVRESP